VQKLRLFFFLCRRSLCSASTLTHHDNRCPAFLIAAWRRAGAPRRQESDPEPERSAAASSPSLPARLWPRCVPRPQPTGTCPYTSFEPWLAQEEKLSYRESLRDSKLSTSCPPELFKEAASLLPFPSFCPSTLFRQFFSFSNNSTLLLLNLLRDSREILDNLFWESSFVSSVCFHFCNK